MPATTVNAAGESGRHRSHADRTGAGRRHRRHHRHAHQRRAPSHPARRGTDPIVDTLLYEGGNPRQGGFAIGETAARQLQPAIGWLGRHKHPRRWFAVGNDYIWPQRLAPDGARLHRASRRRAGRRDVVPFGTTDFSQPRRAPQGQRRRCPVSLIGQDAIEFNRAFGRTSLPRAMLRLSRAIGENELLGIGADNAEDLYMACGYFATLDTEANLASRSATTRISASARRPSTPSASRPRGQAFPGRADRREASSPHGLPGTPGRHADPLPQRAEADYQGGGVNRTPIYLARAEGNGVSRQHATLSELRNSCCFIFQGK